MENEILGAEIYLHPVDTGSANAAVDAELEKVEQALKMYSHTESMADYAMAAAGGILAGAVDAFITGETDFLRGDQKPIGEQLTEVLKKLLTEGGIRGGAAKPIKVDFVSKGIPAMIPELEKLAKKPTPMGLLAAVLFQIGQGGMLRFAEDNEIKALPQDVSKDGGILLAVSATIVGVLKWLQAISAEEEEDSFGIRLKTLSGICELIRAVPAFSDVINEIEKWQKQLPNEIKHRGGEADRGVDIEGVFCSFFTMLGSLPAFKNTDLPKIARFIREKNRSGKNEIPIVKMLARQALPVLVNEIVTRTMFFASRLAGELKKNGGINGVNWERTVPVGNTEINRLLAISSMTLSVADTADAAIRAAIDYCGKKVFSPEKFVTRFNYLAAGRAAVAVARVISDEQAEQELLQMKLVLTQAKTANALRILQEYRQGLERRVSLYLAEDITAFLKGFEQMDRGLAGNDSDLVIRGNVTIQRVLGKIPQFENQREFDELMDSEKPLRL